MPINPSLEEDPSKRQSREFSSPPSSFLCQPRGLSLQKVGESSEKMIFDSTQKSPQGIGKPQAWSSTYWKNNLVELRYSVLEHFTQLPCLRPRVQSPALQNNSDNYFNKIVSSEQMHTMYTHFVLKLLWEPSQMPISFSLKREYKEGLGQVLKWKSTARFQLALLVHQPQESWDSRSPGAGDTGSAEPPGMAAGNWTQVLCKSSTYSWALPLNLTLRGRCREISVSSKPT